MHFAGILRMWHHHQMIHCTVCTVHEHTAAIGCPRILSLLLSGNITQYSEGCVLCNSARSITIIHTVSCLLCPTSAWFQIKWTSQNSSLNSWKFLFFTLLKRYRYTLKVQITVLHHSDGSLWKTCLKWAWFLYQCKHSGMRNLPRSRSSHLLCHSSQIMSQILIMKQSLKLLPRSLIHYSLCSGGGSIHIL